MLKRFIMNIEDLPTFQSTAKRRQFGYDAKETKDPWNEGKRYLGRRVGESWNTVWADICTPQQDRGKAKLFSFLKQQINEGHLVYFNCFKKDDGIYTIWYNEFRVDKEITHGWRRSKEYYVYNGILCQTAYETIVRPKELKVVKFNDVEYAQKDDVWFKVVLKPIGLSWTGRYNSYDSLRKKIISHGDGYMYYGRPVHCSAHYPLKTKELRALKTFLTTQKD